MAEDQPQGVVSQNVQVARVGLNLDATLSQVSIGELTFALNAVIEGSDGNKVTYQNEWANELCSLLPKDYRVIGVKGIIEKNIIMFWLHNPLTNDDEIGTIYVPSCLYTTFINAKCLGFGLVNPIYKIVVKETNCGTEVYWAQKGNPPRFVNLQIPPYKTIDKGCDTITTTEIDCNKLRMFPNFSIPSIDITAVDSDGELDAGTYQFALQYSNALGEPYTAFYNPTNPTPIFDPYKITPDFNYKVGQSINLTIKGIDTTGFYEYINLAVVKTINNISSVELVGLYKINLETLTVVYAGQSLQKLTAEELFQKYTIYEGADDLTSSQDILILDQLTSQLRVSFQKIANLIHLEWQTTKLPKDSYKNELIATNQRGYMRDEVYPFEIVPIFSNGYQCDGFHIPSRKSLPTDLVVAPTGDNVELTPQPYWKVYNTAYSTSADNSIGEFAYWESLETYPCNEEIYGDLAGKPIRHHKFPDSTLTHIHDNSGNIYPIGIRIDTLQVLTLIQQSDLPQSIKDKVVGFKIVRGNRVNNKSIIAKGLINNVGKYTSIYNQQTYFFPNYLYNDVSGSDQFINGTTFDTDSKSRFTFHSPDTSFYQPYLGNILKLETVEYGESTGHYTQCQKHAKYKLYIPTLYFTALGAAGAVILVSRVVGVTDTVVDGVAFMTTYQTLVDIFQKITPRINYAYQLNSIGDYSSFIPVQNTGNKQRSIQLGEYITPGFQSVADTHIVNNFQRETSVYIKSSSLPYTNEVGAPQDKSKNNGDTNKGTGTIHTPISSYYASIKRDIPNQYGQLYSYETIDTGLYVDLTKPILQQDKFKTVWGGDIFINKFAYKAKLPLFIENRVNAVDESDIFYNELYNIGAVKYWFSFEQNSGQGRFGTLFGTPTINLDVEHNAFLYKTGRMYIAAYGIPYFYTESEVNVDLRQAFNQKEGDFFPRVSSDIPDDWLQEYNVPIVQDNTYYYNKTYSKQNKETVFTHLPDNYSFKDCLTTFPFRAIFSERQSDFVNYKRNNWLLFKPASYFDFPQNYGKLVSLDGTENRQVFARFENKALLYNALLTTNSSIGQVYLGQSLFNKDVPAIDYVDSDLGFLGTQHKLLLRTENGVITTDAKRGQIFLVSTYVSAYSRPSFEELTSQKFKCQQWFTQNLNFAILEAFPEYPVDNAFNGIGLTGVYDARLNRLIITKRDYKLLNTLVTYDPYTYKFYIDKIEVSLDDPNYFAERSFTMSFDFESMRWISPHTYTPNYYVGYSNWFYSGIQGSLWSHNTQFTKFNNFYGVIQPYTIEHPYYFQGKEEILQSIKNYSRVEQMVDYEEFIETDDIFFNKCILRNSQQCSGILELVPRPQKASEYITYPKYNSLSKTITFTKKNSCYNINTFWSILKDSKQQIFKKFPHSIFPELNQANMNYSKMFYKKFPLLAKDLLVRFQLDNRDDVRITSEFNLTLTQESFN